MLHSLLDGSLPADLNEPLLAALGPVSAKQLFALCGISRSARQAIRSSKLDLVLANIVLGAGYGTWQDMLRRMAHCCPTARTIEFCSCDVDSAALGSLRSGIFPALTSLRLLRCYHIRAPYNNEPEPEPVPEPEPPAAASKAAAACTDKMELEAEDDELALQEIVAFSLNVVEPGFSLRNAQSLVLTNCESSPDVPPAAAGLLNMLAVAAPCLRHLFLGGSKMQLVSVGRPCSLPTVELCELTFWSDGAKDSAKACLPNAKLIDLSDLSAGPPPLRLNERDLPWRHAVDCRGRRGVRPLHLAAIADDGVAVDWLLQAGADVEAKDTKGCTPLFRACQHSATSPCKQLLAKGADPLRANQGLETPMYIAALCGATDCVTALLEADTEGRAPGFGYYDGWSPLHAACLRVSVEIARALLEAGFDACCTNKWHQSPMHVVARVGSVPLAELLLGHESTAAPDTRAQLLNGVDVDRLTPLRIAQNKGNSELVEWFVGNGASAGTAKGKGKGRKGRRGGRKGKRGGRGGANAGGNDGGGSEGGAPAGAGPVGA